MWTRGGTRRNWACYWKKIQNKLAIPNENSEKILITEKFDFILSDRTSAISRTADMNFKTRLEADFKRKIKMWSSCSDKDDRN